MREREREITENERKESRTCLTSIFFLKKKSENWQDVQCRGKICAGSKAKIYTKYAQNMRIPEGKNLKMRKIWAAHIPPVQFYHFTGRLSGRGVNVTIPQHCWARSRGEKDLPWATDLKYPTQYIYTKQNTQYTTPNGTKNDDVKQIKTNIALEIWRTRWNPGSSAPHSTSCLALNWPDGVKLMDWKERGTLSPNFRISVSSHSRRFHSRLAVLSRPCPGIYHHY